MQRFAVIAIVLVGLGLLVWQFPLFHIVRLNQQQVDGQEDAFDPAAFVDRFWRERLVPSLDQAADAGTVLAAMRADPKAARQRFGRSVGVGRSFFVLLRGRGTIAAVEHNTIRLELEDHDAKAQIALRTGPLFGNVVREATGLLSASDYPNSQQFNRISTELNRLVEAKVIVPLKEHAEVGRRIEFIGCAELMDESAKIQPLELIPLEVKVE